MSPLFEVLQRLAATIESRKGGDPSTSYTAKLLADPALAATIFHFGEISIGEAKRAMADAGIPVRLDDLKGAA